MKLQKYLNKNNLKYSPWAVKNKLSPSTIYRFLNGENISIKNALMIQKATKGEVTLQDMFASK
jgi:predicted transcriptional regulator